MPVEFDLKGIAVVVMQGATAVSTETEVNPIEKPNLSRLSTYIGIVVYSTVCPSNLGERFELFQAVSAFQKEIWTPLQLIARRDFIEPLGD